MSKVNDYLLHLEKELMTGKGSWVADFTESFRDLRINGVLFNMVIRGNTRAKGFFLSKLFSYLTLPNYQVACLVFNGGRVNQVDKQTLTTLLEAAKSYMKDNELKWSWLIIAQAEGFSEKIKAMVSNLAIQEIGVALVDISSLAIISSKNYLGRAISRYIK